MGLEIYEQNINGDYECFQDRQSNIEGGGGSEVVGDY